jgi:phosphotransferase family enzyme
MDATSLAASLGRPIASVSRRPYPYRTSHKLDELQVVLSDGTRVDLLLKDLRFSELGASARSTKPAFLHNPLREVEAYRLLASTGLGTPICHDAGDDWVLLEKVPGVELWQVGDLDVWAETARWLTRFHALFVEHPPPADHLLRYDADYFRIWPERAVHSYPVLASLLGGYDRVVDLLAGLPVTLIHGEFYASNILVAGERIAPVDWEMAGIGPGVLDMAALSSGWGDVQRATIEAAYGGARADSLNAARLHIALQWLGWSREWTAPPQHAHDWLSEAIRAAERLGFSIG